MMTIEGLIELRNEVVAHLDKRRAQLEAQIEQLSATAVAPRRGRPPGRRGHPLRGRKVPPKYRGPKGETWAGRGATPLWLVALLKQGRKLQDFAINKGATSTQRVAAKRKKWAVKRSRRKK